MRLTEKSRRIFEKVKAQTRDVRVDDLREACKQAGITVVAHDDGHSAVLRRGSYRVSVVDADGWVRTNNRSGLRHLAEMALNGF